MQDKSLYVARSSAQTSERTYDKMEERAEASGVHFAGITKDSSISGGGSRKTRI